MRVARRRAVIRRLADADFGDSDMETTQDAHVDLCYLSAFDALRMFRHRELSPVELMQAVIDRCESVNPKVNALTYTYFDRALREAREAEQRYAHPGYEPRPLAGIPLA